MRLRLAAVALYVIITVFLFPRSSFFVARASNKRYLVEAWDDSGKVEEVLQWQMA